MVKIIKPVVEVKELGRYFIINPIDSQGNINSYIYDKKLTPPLNLNGQIQEYYEKQKQLEDFTPATSLEIGTLISDARISKHSGLINHLHNTFRNNLIRSFSQVNYCPNLDDNGILHYPGVSDEFFKKGIVHGPNGYVNDLSLEQRMAFKLIYGKKGLLGLNKDSQAINQTPFYIWRLNSKPSEKIQAGVDFDSNAGRFNVIACYYLSYQDPAIRVLREK